MPSLGIVPGAERTTDERLIRGSPGRWVDKRATNECEFPPLDIGVQAIQLSPYRSGVAGPPHTRLLLSPAFQPCACPLALSGPGQAVASESSALNSGPLRGQFTPCVTWRTLSISSSFPVTYNGTWRRPGCSRCSASWHARQVTRVFRRYATMRWIHRGFSLRPGLCRSASLRM